MAHASTARAPRRKGSRPTRPEGQWFVDGRTPLNHNEEVKALGNGLDVRTRIETRYAREGFDSIEDDDLHSRFRWWGLYTQRRPGIDGGRTAQLSPEELEDRCFMLRIRSDGGALSTEQLRTIGQISEDFGRGTADITDRQNIQLHWIEIENVPEIWRRLEAVGLSTTEACGDCPRVILGSPLAGIAADEILDPTPVIEEIQRRFIGDPDLANLPRKFKTAVTGHRIPDVVHEINDISLVGVEHPELGAGYDLWVGGALSTTPRLAERLGAFVTPEQAPEVWHGVVRIFRDYGMRRLRTKARLKFLLADWGTERFRDVLETEYLGYRLADGPAPAHSEQRADHVGVQRQRDGLLAVGLSPTVGRVSGRDLVALAAIAEDAGSTRTRLTPHQKILVLDVNPDRADRLLGACRDLGLSAVPSSWRRGTIACTGLEFCKLAIVETKAVAQRTISILEERLADLEPQLGRPISLHVNGCPNSCARIQAADIGLKGQIVTTADGQQVPGFQVHLGGGLAGDGALTGGLGRTIRRHKVTAEDLPEYVERVVRGYLAERGEDETFAEWAHRAEEEILR